VFGVRVITPRPRDAQLGKEFVGNKAKNEPLIREAERLAAFADGVQASSLFFG
jgi:hypothetical protein